MRFLLTIILSIILTKVHAQLVIPNEYEENINLILENISLAKPPTKTREDLKIIAFDLQNKSQILDEIKHDFEGSLILVDKAITLFNYLDDTLNLANNLKFKGYLLGKLGNFTQGKDEIKKAIYLFELKKKDWGVAVSEFDLALVYELENKLDSAIYYCNTSIAYWTSQNNFSRVFGNQTMLINMLVQYNQLGEAKVMQKTLAQKSNYPDMHWQNILNFYFVSANMFEATKEIESSINYQLLYINKLAELNQNGIEARSYYDDYSIKKHLSIKNKSGVLSENPKMATNSDKTIFPFADSSYKLVLKLYDFESFDADIKNATLTLRKEEEKGSRIIFSDSLFCMYNMIEFVDVNNDQVKDILVFNYTGARANPSYHLYLIDNDHKKLIRVKGFEELPNPSLDAANNIIVSVAISGTNNYSFYRLNKNHKLINLGYSFEEVTNDSDQYENAIKHINTKWK